MRPGLNEPFAIAVNNALTHKILENARRAQGTENEYLNAELRGNREIVWEGPKSGYTRSGTTFHRAKVL